MRLTSFPQFGRSNGTRYIALPYNQARFGTLAAYWDDDRDALGLLQQTGIYCAFEQSMLQVTLALPRFSMEKAWDVDAAPADAPWCGGACSIR